MTNDTPTTEQMLAAVIEAQVRGGCDNWNPLKPETFSMAEEYLFARSSASYQEEEQVHVFAILLDPQGLRAAYCQQPSRWDLPETERIAIPARHILDAWLSKPEGDAEAAIRTAYDLLPSSR